MKTIVITLKNDGRIADGGIDTFTKPATPNADSLNINHHLDLDTIIHLLDQVDDDEVKIRQSITYPNWSRGDPCPECGSSELAIMELREATYISSESEFEFDHLTNNTGPQLSIVCKECQTHLSHVPYYALTE
jgi:hypothetical protein